MYIGKGYKQGPTDDKGGAFLGPDGHAVFNFSCRPHSTLPFVDATPTRTSHPRVLTASITLDLAHRRFAHLNQAAIRALAQDGGVANLRLSSSTSTFCDDCAAGKATRCTFPRSDTRASHPLQLIHSDLLKMPVRSPSGCKYLVTFLDNYTRKLWVYPLRNKSDTFSNFQQFRARVENETGWSIVILRTDHLGEFISSAFEGYLVDHGIQHQFSAVYTP